MVIFKTYHQQSRAQTTKGFTVELIPVILYIEMPACDVVEPKAQWTTANVLWQTSFARVDKKILSLVFFLTNVFANLIGVPVSFVIETLSCELALANSSLKISGNLVSGPLLVHVLERLCWLTK